MKKLVLLGSLLTAAIGFSQTTSDSRDQNLSVYGSFIELKHIGASIEFKLGKKEGESDKTANRSRKIFNMAYGMMDYEVGGYKADGTGLTVDLGNRFYWQEPNKGFYTGSNLSYGTIDFDENGFSGNYEYISIFNPELGYKLFISDRITLDGFFGYMWKIEIRGGGFIDNKNVDNWTPRAGLKLGYQF